MTWRAILHDILRAVYRPQCEAVSVALPDGRPSHV